MGAGVANDEPYPGKLYGDVLAPVSGTGALQQLDLVGVLGFRRSPSSTS